LRHSVYYSLAVVTIARLTSDNSVTVVNDASSFTTDCQYRFVLISYTRRRARDRKNSLTALGNYVMCVFCLFSERELTFTFAICCHPFVCLSSVTFVHPTQAVQIFGNISTPLGNLAIHGHPLKISRRSSQGNPSAAGVKDKRGSQI